MLEPGTVIDGRYRILRIIGKGGMSMVYLAVNERAGKLWAVKEIRKDGVNSCQVMRRNLEREREILKTLHDPGIPCMADVIDREEDFLIVMDYIEGQTLGSLLKEQGAQAPETVAGWGIRLCRILGYLHSRVPPVIYGDMKPSNIMLKPDGEIVLIDFGTAAGKREKSLPNAVRSGTRGYAAPEQYTGSEIRDERTDLYGLGMTLYQLVTGYSPAEIRRWSSAGHLLQTPSGTGLENILQKCICPDPEQRFRSAAEMKYVLRHLQKMEESSVRKRKKYLRLFLGTGLLSAAFLFLAGAFWFRAGRDCAEGYEERIRAARKAAGKTREKKYLEAVRWDPFDEAGYRELLQNVFLSDAYFSCEEAETVQKILGETAWNGMLTDEECLQTDKAAYGRFSMDLGMAYFYYYQGTGNREMAEVWLRNAAASGGLSPEKKKRAAVMLRIAAYTRGLDQKDHSGDQIISYENYWKDLTETTAGDLAAADNVMTALAVYREGAYQISEHVLDFKNYGVTRKKIEEELDRIRTRIRRDILTCPESGEKRIRQILQDTYENLDQAEKQVKIVFFGEEGEK